MQSPLCIRSTVSNFRFNMNFYQYMSLSSLPFRHSILSFFSQILYRRFFYLSLLPLLYTSYNSLTTLAVAPRTFGSTQATNNYSPSWTIIHRWGCSVAHISFTWRGCNSFWWKNSYRIRMPKFKKGCFVEITLLFKNQSRIVKFSCIPH